MHLIDTNVLSELTRRRPDPAVVGWFELQGKYAISVVSLEELAYGIAHAPASRRPKLATWLESLLDSDVIVLDVTPPIARASGELRGARAASGRPVAQADMLIAGTALVHGLTLATRNTGDFVRCGVVVVDPFA